ncbi:MAG: hypothetical protein GWM90_16420, partial [Gemmatimonadetes bacterium]|nr:hypothetical protein [Gemmatimonadota bacterium]NIQ55861.1 hypothetical protein [Gemmatimonadota bacterium]NIU76060.1 hypothetical protein [Gammaproteobacteria bacterium]NIX45626.1 hypothetical protein [Gemmatimonadota bacterium]NIY09914.1 hypothetical protein [Gemmatimonadota bacterium]
EDWAKPVLDYVGAGRRILLHMGIHHAFTRYRQPVVLDGELRRLDPTRAGNYLYEALGDRAFLVYLHALWPPREGYGGNYVRPADGYLDAFFGTLPAGLRRVGFDVRGTPFGSLPGATSVYSHGYDDFTLGTMVDGYIYQGAFCDAEGVTAIPGFIDQDNLAYARQHSVNPASRTATAERFERAAAVAARLDRWCARLDRWEEEEPGR